MIMRKRKFEEILVNDYSKLTDNERSFIGEIEFAIAFKEPISKSRKRRYKNLLKKVTKKLERVPTESYIESLSF